VKDAKVIQGSEVFNGLRGSALNQCQTLEIGKKCFIKWRFTPFPNTVDPNSA
jgi:hypothetical protein